MVTGLSYTHDPNFSSLSWFWRCKEHQSPLSPHLGLWRTLEFPHWGLASWSLFGYGHCSLIHPWSKFWLSILILNMQRTFMSFKYWYMAFEDAGGSWLGFDILILTWILSRTLLGSTLKFWSHSDQWKFRYSQCKSWFWALEDTGGSWLGLASWSWFGYGHWSLICPWSEVWLSIMIFKVQRTSMSFKS